MARKFRFDILIPCNSISVKIRGYLSVNFKTCVYLMAIFLLFFVVYKNQEVNGIYRQQYQSTVMDVNELNELPYLSCEVVYWLSSTIRNLVV